MSKILLSPAGWEERFLRGTIADIEEFDIEHLLIPYSIKYASHTELYRRELKKYASSKSIVFSEFDLDYNDDIALYKGVSFFLSNYIKSNKVKLYFNITSTPRDFIWYVLHYISINNIKTFFSYYRPEFYAPGYLSCNAGRPRLVLKRSGIVYPDKQTCILALSGYDVERLSQLKYQFEPKVILIGRQTGNQFENIPRNATIDSPIVKEFDFDCYDVSDSSISIIKNILSPYLNEYNILSASLGPKTCAITLFYITQLIPEIGLVYIPANDYNLEYSRGIDLQKAIHLESSWG